ncbi:MAG: hypothetical protein ACREQ5_33125 [Candidatus Dormibacteria bacterium]
MAHLLIPTRSEATPEEEPMISSIIIDGKVEVMRSSYVEHKDWRGINFPGVMMMMMMMMMFITPGADG